MITCSQSPTPPARSEPTFRLDDVSVRRSGTFQIAESRITFTDDPLQDDGFVGQRSFDLTRDGDALLLRDTEVVWDADNDGTAEVTALDIRLEAGS